MEAGTDAARVAAMVQRHGAALLRVALRERHRRGGRLRRDLADAGRSVEERAESAERASRSAEALRALKHDEALALMLKAEGYSYQEIGERLRWTYTNVFCPLGPCGGRRSGTVPSGAFTLQGDWHPPLKRGRPRGSAGPSEATSGRRAVVSCSRS